MNRRDFLHPRNLLGPARHALAAADVLQSAGSDSDDVSSESVILRFARRAMATIFEVLLPFGLTGAQEMAHAALDRIDSLEDQLSVYREESEVSRLNRLAVESPIPVAENLFDLLVLSRELHRQTEGAFDIAIGALIKTWGFYHRAGRVPGDAELAAARGRIGMEHIRLDPSARTVAFDRAGMEINLGSIGKGFALDVAGRDLRRQWRCRDALLHGGHSSILAIGDEPGSADGWAVGLLDPVQRDARLAILRLKNRALSTSAATFQSLEHQGKKLPHLLDPRTAWPAEGMLQASVTAPSAAVADALATAFFILGVEKSRAYCDTHPEVGAVLVPSDGPLTVLGRCRGEMKSPGNSTRE